MTTTRGPGTGRTATQAGATGIGVEDPLTGEDLARIPAGGPADAARIVAAVHAARDGWARTPPGDRAGLLRTWAARIRSEAGELARTQSREVGRPLPASRAGIEAAAGAIEQYAELGPLHRGRSLAGGWDAVDLMLHEPYGVAVGLTPWNDPAAIAAQAAAALLVTGNVVVLKPSERSPLTVARMVDLAPFPEDVLRLALGDADMGRALVAHPDVDVVLHVGSVATGREIARVCAARDVHCVLELGGKDPLVVDGDVDPAWAAAQAATGAFANCGQVCTSVERIYVHRGIADAFLGALVREAEAIVVGDPLQPGVGMGPMVDTAQRAHVLDQLGDAVRRGARILTGGEPPDVPGAFLPPTVVVVPDDASRLMREETFGPVAPVRVVEDFDEGLRAACDTTYGLAATVLTASQDNAQRAWRCLPAGTVKVNAVWGGAPGGAAQPRRSSGRGFGYGPELLDEVTRVKVVHMRPAVTP